jgi:hypothetical protein
MVFSLSCARAAASRSGAPARSDVVVMKELGMCLALRVSVARAD